MTTARDLKAADPDRIGTKFSVVMQRIVLELRGIPSIEIEDIAPKQQIIRSRSFGQRVTTLEHLRQAVTMHVSRAAEKLRAQYSVCGLAQVSIRTGLPNPRASLQQSRDRPISRPHRRHSPTRQWCIDGSGVDLSRGISLCQSRGGVDGSVSRQWGAVRFIARNRPRAISPIDGRPRRGQPKHGSRLSSQVRAIPNAFRG